MDRELTEPESAVLRALLARGHEVTPGAPISDVERQRWLAQVDATRVVGRCGCGECPSVDLAVTDVDVDPSATRSTVLGASTAHAMLLAFVDEGRLSYLELAPVDPGAAIVDFPPVEVLDFDPPQPVE